MSEIETNNQLDQLIRVGDLNRRQFMKRAAALGVTASAAGSMLAVGTTSHAAGHAQKGGTLREGYDLDFSKHDLITTNWYDPAFFEI